MTTPRTIKLLRVDAQHDSGAVSVYFAAGQPLPARQFVQNLAALGWLVSMEVEAIELPAGANATLCLRTLLGQIWPMLDGDLLVDLLLNPPGPTWIDPDQVVDVAFIEDGTTRPSSLNGSPCNGSAAAPAAPTTDS